MKPKTLWIISAPPGAGKTTFLDHFFANKPDTAIISRDKVRFSILKKHPNCQYFDQERKVFKEFTKRIEYAFSKYDNVVADATHLNVKSRNKLINALYLTLKDYKANINCIYLDVPIEVALKRNAKREGLALVPENAIKSMYNSYVFPTYHEDFIYNAIYQVDENENMVLICPDGTNRNGNHWEWWKKEMNNL